MNSPSRFWQVPSSLLLAAFPAGIGAQTPTADLEAQESLPILLADSGVLLDAATTYRTQVTLRQPTDLTRLQALGVIILTQSDTRATVLATGEQLQVLARLRFQPRHSDQVALLLGRTGLDARESISEGTILALTSADSDGDGLTNTEEAWWCTDPNDPNSDSDAEGYSDGEEVAALLDFTLPHSVRWGYGPPFGLPAAWPDWNGQDGDPDTPACDDGDYDTIPDFAEIYVVGSHVPEETTDYDKFDDGQELGETGIYDCSWTRCTAA